MPCCTSDYLPTILEVVGQSEPAVEAAPLDGISLVDLIHGRMTERPSPIAFASRSQQTLVDNRYKIYSDDNGASFELFDLIADPAESSNLAQQHPEIVRKMRETLAAWHTSCLNDAP